MSFEIGDPLSEGFDRLTERNGLMFVGLFVALGVITSLLAADFASAVIADLVESGDLDPADIQSDTNPLLGDDPTEQIIGLPASVALFGMFLGVLAHASISIAAARTFAGDETEEIPREHFTRKLVWSLGNIVVGGFLFSIALAIGFVLFVVPGLFLLVSLYFWVFPVVLDDESFIGGFAKSWTLTSGNRLPLFFLGVIVVVLSFVTNIVGSVISAPFPPLAEIAVSGVFSGAVFVFTVATAARAYRQLERERSIETGAAAGTETESDTMF
jgi:hypothetical protein